MQRNFKQHSGKHLPESRKFEDVKNKTRSAIVNMTSHVNDRLKTKDGYSTHDTHTHTHQRKTMYSMSDSVYFLFKDVLKQPSGKECRAATTKKDIYKKSSNSSLHQMLLT